MTAEHPLQAAYAAWRRRWRAEAVAHLDARALPGSPRTQIAPDPWLRREPDPLPEVRP